MQVASTAASKSCGAAANLQMRQRCRARALRKQRHSAWTIFPTSHFFHLNLIGPCSCTPDCQNERNHSQAKKLISHTHVETKNITHVTKQAKPWSRLLWYSDFLHQRPKNEIPFAFAEHFIWNWSAPAKLPWKTNLLSLGYLSTESNGCHMARKTGRKPNDSR